MPKVVVKGESVYKCNVCSRSIRVPTNKQGLDVLQRCNITYQCQGKLSRVTTAKEINETPAFPPSVQGVSDWFQRRVLYTHEQPVASSTWIVKHNLVNRPKVYTYVNRLVNNVETLVKFNPATETTIDENNIRLTFNTAESGLAQCIALASQNVVNPTATIAPTVSSEALQFTTDVGEITLATLDDSPLVALAITYRTSGTLIDTVIEYAGIDAIPSVNSPWSGSSKVVINGRIYTLRSFNLTTTPLAPVYFASGSVSEGSTFFISNYNGAPPSAAECLILLARAPYTPVDRVTDKYIDVSTINSASPEFFYSTGRGFTQLTTIRSTYPHILVVE